MSATTSSRKRNLEITIPPPMARMSRTSRRSHKSIFEFTSFGIALDVPVGSRLQTHAVCKGADTGIEMV
jgi:hypothetical protein